MVLDGQPAWIEAIKKTLAIIGKKIFIRCR
jgi:hypothetical protein